MYHSGVIFALMLFPMCKCSDDGANLNQDTLDQPA